MREKHRILPLFVPHLGCPHDCVFCNQRVISGAQRPVTAEDVRSALAALHPAERGIEVAFYGGSFTALPLEAQSALLGAVQPWMDAGVVASVRLSTRPDAISGEVLDLLRQMRVETVEIGAQSMDDAVLSRSGRGHAAADTVNAAKLLRQRGFRLILQMMTGLPGSSPDSDLATARALAALKPDGVRIYPTVILRDTALYRLWQAGAYESHSVEDAVEICAEILPVFSEAGIPVIRLGLNPTEDLSAGLAAAGAYHPALGELVRSRILLNRARALLCSSVSADHITLGVNRAEISQMVGQHRCNVTALQGEFGLKSVKVAAIDVPPGEIRLILS